MCSSFVFGGDFLPKKESSSAIRELMSDFWFMISFSSKIPAGGIAGRDGAW
jgi:hypothetical protein